MAATGSSLTHFVWFWFGNRGSYGGFHPSCPRSSSSVIARISSSVGMVTGNLADNGKWQQSSDRLRDLSSVLTPHHLPAPRYSQHCSHSNKLLYSSPCLISLHML